MKDFKRVFLMLLLVAIIVLLVIGVGKYVYEKRKTEVPINVVNNSQEQNLVIQKTTTAIIPLTDAGRTEKTNSDSKKVSNIQPVVNNIDNINSTTKDSDTNSGIKIYSISKSSGPVGTDLTFKVGFSNDIYRGPEYSTQVLIKKDNGETAVVEAMADFDTVTFTIQKNMCSVNLGGEGGSCPTDRIVVISPGSYKIYFENAYFQPNIISNAIPFVVTDTPISTGTSSIGLQKILVLLVSYLNSEIPPVTTEWIRDRIFNGSFNKFYKEQSYNQIFFNGDVYGWITLKRNDDNHNDVVCTVSSKLMSDQGEAEIINYLEQNNVNLSNYDGLILVVNTPNTGPCSHGVKSDRVIGGKIYNLFVSEIPISNSNQIQQTSAPYPMTPFEASVIHEMGHNLGVGHANGWDCNDQILYGDCQEIGYGGLFDVMGTAHDSFQFGAYFKDLLGWIKPERKIIINKSGTYTINPLESDTGIATAIIQSNGATFPQYYLEFRRNIGFDSYIDRYPYNGRGLVVTQPQQDKSYRLLNMVPIAHDRSSSNAWVYDLAGNHSTLNGVADNPNPSVFYDDKSGITVGPVTNVSDKSIEFKVVMP